MQSHRYDQAMQEALSLAHQAADLGEVPVGAVVLNVDMQIVGRGYNTRECSGNPLNHAEIVAMTEAAKHIGSWRLDDCTLVVTLEPCSMCAGAIVQSRLARVVFGTFDAKAGAVGSLWDLVRDRRLPHRAEVISGVMAQDCAKVLTTFFNDQRLN